MKKLIFALFLMATGLFAQSGIMNDYPLGGGAGYVGTWVVPNVSDINKAIMPFTGMEFSKSGFYTNGGAGFIYVGLIPRLRVGGFGYGGGTMEKVSSGGYNREQRLSLNYGGLSVEYSLPQFRKFSVSLGANLGMGMATIEMYKYQGDVDFNTLLGTSGNTDGAVTSYGRKLQSMYFTLSPTINIDYPYNPLIAFRLGAGYNMILAQGDWKVDNGQVLKNAPEMNMNSFSVQLGIFVGLFFF